MKNRPTSVTVISWLLIVMGLLNVPSTLITMASPEMSEQVRELMAKSPIPIPVQYAMMFIGIAVMILCGAMMLQGQNWARWFYIGWSLFGLVVSFATSPMKAMIVPSLVFTLIIVFFLFRPAANEFFAGSVEPEGNE